MAEVNTAAGLYPTQLDLRDALRRLRKRNLEFDQLSVAGRAVPRDALLNHLAVRRIELDSPLCGTFWVTGPLADSILASVRDATYKNGESELAVGLCRAGVSRYSAREYEDALAHGQSILMAHGSFDEITRAVEVLCEGARAVRLHVDCHWDA
jgi:hypothetical protein